mgnify:CR=1 FL=1
MATVAIAAACAATAIGAARVIGASTACAT